MKSSEQARSAGRLFVRYAAVSVLPVLLLGVVLAASYRAEANRRGLAEGESEAALVAHTAVEPLLAGRQLAGGLSPAERSALDRLVKNSPSGTILRLRVRDLSGRVVFSGDGSGLNDKPDDEAVDAGRGEVVTLLTRLNADGNDNGPRGVEAVEAYRALAAGPAHRSSTSAITWRCGWSARASKQPTSSPACATSAATSLRAISSHAPCRLISWPVGSSPHNLHEP